MEVMREINLVDFTKIKKILSYNVKLQKLKEMQEEFSDDCHNCPAGFKEEFLKVKQQLQNTTNNYDNWLQKI